MKLSRPLSIKTKMNLVIGLKILFLHLVIGVEQDIILSISPAILPSGRIHTAAVYDNNDTIYILGGLTNEGPVKSILKFNITTEKLESIATLPVASWGATAIWDGTGVVYFGGNTTQGSIDTIRRYIPGKSVTQAAGTLPMANYYSTASSVNDLGEAFIFGGASANAGNKIVKYSKRYASIIYDARLPNEIQGASSIHYGKTNEDLIYIFGGGSNGLLDSIVMYNPASGHSSVLSQELPFPLGYSSAIFNGIYAYIIGGTSCANKTNVIRFNPLNKEVVNLNVNNFPDQLNSSSVVFVPKLNRTYIFGGRTGSVYRDQIMYLTF